MPISTTDTNSWHTFLWRLSKGNNTCKKIAPSCYGCTNSDKMDGSISDLDMRGE